MAGLKLDVVPEGDYYCEYCILLDQQDNGSDVGKSLNNS